MLRTSTLSTLSTLLLCLAATGIPALAQQKPSDAPPKLDVIEPGSDVPAVMVPKAGGTKIVEKKEGGVVTEAKVKSGPSTYTMKPNVPAGNAQPGDGVSNATRAPQWTVLEFDLLKKKKAQGAAAAETVDAPPPQTAKPAAKPPAK